MVDAIDLNQTFDEFESAAKQLEPDQSNFTRIRKSGGSENRYGEETGQTEHRADLELARLSQEQRADFEGGRFDVDADLQVSSHDPDALRSGDILEDQHTGKVYRVFDVTDVGGEEYPQAGIVASLEEQET